MTQPPRMPLLFTVFPQQVSPLPFGGELLEGRKVAFLNPQLQLTDMLIYSFANLLHLENAQ